MHAPDLYSSISRGETQLISRVRWLRSGFEPATFWFLSWTVYEIQVLEANLTSRGGGAWPRRAAVVTGNGAFSSADRWDEKQSQKPYKETNNLKEVCRLHHVFVHPGNRWSSARNSSYYFLLIAVLKHQKPFNVLLACCVRGGELFNHPTEMTTCSNVI